MSCIGQFLIRCNQLYHKPDKLAAMSKRNRQRRLIEESPTVVATSNQSSQPWLERGIVWLFHLTLLTVPLFFHFKTDELFEFNKMILVYFFTILIAAAWGWRMIDERRWIFTNHWLNWLVFLFLGSQVVSALTSLHPYTSWLGYYSRFHGGVVSYLCYTVLFLAATANVRKKHLVPLLITSLLSAIVVSVYGILEHFGHSFSCSLAGGNFDVACWVQDVQNRVYATFGQPNWMAAYLLTLTPLAIWLAASAKQLWVRLLGLTATAGMVWALLYTKSRSGFFGLILALGIYGLVWLFVWWRHRSSNAATTAGSISTRWTLGSFALIAAAMIISGSEVVPGIAEIWKRESAAPAVVETTAEAAPVDRLVIGGTDSGEIRKIVWGGAIDVWKRYPILGSGPETFAYSYYLDRPLAHNMVSEWDFLYNRAHNELLNFLATTGIVGLGSYLALLAGGCWLFFLGFRKNLSSNPGRSLVFAALFAGTAGLAVSNFFGFSTVTVALLQYLFFAVASILLSTDKPTHSGKKEYAWQQYVLFTITGLVAGMLLISLMRYYRADLAFASSKRLLQAGNLRGAITAINEAVALNPQEATYWDTMSTQLAQAAVGSANVGERVQLAEAAVKAVEMAQALNPEQRNFSKTSARAYILLAQLDPKYYNDAIAVLTEGIEKAPTDAKLYYNRGLLYLEQDNPTAGLADLQKSVELKPNYEPSLAHLANQAAATGDFAQAKAWAEQILRYNPTHSTAPAMVASYSAGLVYSATLVQ